MASRWATSCGAFSKAIGLASGFGTTVSGSSG